MRFECFSSTWHHCLLNDCVIFLDEQRKPIKEADRKKIKGEYPYYGASGIIDNINSYIFDDDLILLSEDGANILDRNYRVSFIVRGKIWVNNHAHVLKPKNKIDINYLSEYLENLDYAKYNTGSAQPKLNQDLCKNIIINIPDYNEQQKIGKFLSIINQRIDTQSKIIEDLELFKKGIWNYIYLTKSSDWKCVKLSDILCERKDFALKGDEFIHATLSKDGIFAKTDRYDRDFLVTNDEKEYKITRLNDICYNPANLKFGVICLNKFGDAIFSPIYVTYIVKNDFIPSFVELILTSSRFLKYIRKYEQGTVYERMAVNSEDFLKGEILIPTKDKQKAIADYFDMLDLKIKKEKDILELYKKQKAYLLKNMFI